MYFISLGSSCQNSTFVDRTEYQESKIITCPLPGCSYTWCKSCSQAIDTVPGAPEHSCDGTSELDHLMKERGWKYCPGRCLVPISRVSDLILTYRTGCKTPVQKDGGCNHMTVRRYIILPVACFVLIELFFLKSSARRLGAIRMCSMQFLWFHADLPPPVIFAMCVVT